MKTRKAFLAALLVAVTMLGFSYTQVGAQTIQRSYARVGRMLVGDGSVGAPSITFASQPDLGFYKVQANRIGYGVGSTLYAYFDGPLLDLNRDNSQILFGSSADTAVSRTAAGKISLTGTTPMIQLGGTTSSFPALKQSGATLQVRLADDSAYASFSAATVNLANGLAAQTTLLSLTAPTMGACGTSPSVTVNNGTAAFSVNVGTGGTASTCVINLPVNTTGWICDALDITNPTTGGGYFVKQTAGTTSSVTLTGFNTAGAATAWTASDILRVKCTGY